MIAWIRSSSRWLILTFACFPMLGCVVAQAPGKGQTQHVQAPDNKGWYWMYLPDGYDPNAQPGNRGPKRPVVVTFHGMKPFDNANSQVREWQQEADRYGFIVLAPECASPDLLKEFPLRTVNPSVKHDEELTVAMLDDAQQRAEIDPSRVLSTSWSSGGYLAHYIPNRHPDRFSCIAPRQSNFSAEVLDAAMVPRYRDHKVGIFFTENDFAICRKESEEGARWYSQNGFDVTFAVFKDLGHERRPAAAAAFFAETCGVEARTPPTELAHMQVKRVAVPQLAAANGNGAGKAPTATVASAAAMNAPPQPLTQPQPQAPPAKPASNPAQSKPAPTMQDRDSLFAAKSPQRTPPAPSRSAPPLPQPQPQPQPQVADKAPAVESSPLRVRLSSTIGIAPLLVTFSALSPQDLRKDAYFLWLADGQPIANGMTGQKYLTTPGRHQLECVMTTADGREFRAFKSVTVLERVTTSGSSTAVDHP